MSMKLFIWKDWMSSGKRLHSDMTKPDLCTRAQIKTVKVMCSLPDQTCKYRQCLPREVLNPRKVMYFLLCFLWVAKSLRQCHLQREEGRGGAWVSIAFCMGCTSWQRMWAHLSHLLADTQLSPLQNPGQNPWHHEPSHWHRSPAFRYWTRGRVGIPGHLASFP